MVERYKHKHTFYLLTYQLVIFQENEVTSTITSAQTDLKLLVSFHRFHTDVSDRQTAC